MEYDVKTIKITQSFKRYPPLCCI